jgi:A118 family predicted phage portal protein
MLKNIFLWILQNIFKVKTETTQKEVEDNQKYAAEYERIDDINFNSIFSNKLANYVINDSNVNLTGDNARTELLNKTIQSLWKKAKKITSMGFGYGGVILVPYVKGGKEYYSIVPQNRLTIDMTEGDNITGATVLAEKKTVQGTINSKTYLRWTNYKVENGNITITQQFSDEDGNKIPVPDFWKNIQEIQVISGVDRVLFGYIKSPINNRKITDNYGVPITYGCDSTILEIKDTMKQLYREYKLKEAFVGADSTMFDGKDALPKNGLFKKIDSGDDTFFEVFDPAFRPFTDRLQELYKRLEHEIGTSAGILSEVQTQNATATEIKRAMYDTFTIVDDMRTNVEKGLEDFLYAANVLANAYNLSAQGEYEISFDWDYSLLEDSQEAFTQLITANGKGIISDAEVRQFIKPDETIEDSEKAVAEIKASEPSIDQLFGNNNNNNDGDNRE